MLRSKMSFCSSCCSFVILPWRILPRAQTVGSLCLALGSLCLAFASLLARCASLLASVAWLWVPLCLCGALLLPRFASLCWLVLPRYWLGLLRCWLALFAFASLCLALGSLWARVWLAFASLLASSMCSLCVLCMFSLSLHCLCLCRPPPPPPPTSYHAVRGAMDVYRHTNMFSYLLDC